MASNKSASKMDTAKLDQAVAATLLPDGYKPSHDEAFMNDLQLEYFRQKLINWRAELLNEANQTLENLSIELMLFKFNFFSNYFSNRAIFNIAF